MTAASSGTPARTAWRTAASRVSVEPASAPRPSPSASRATPSRTSTAAPPRLVVAVAEPGRGHGVGDQDAPARAGREHRAQDGGVQVHAVGDQLDVDGAVEQRADRSRVAVVERAHRVEEVGAHPGAGVDARRG